jgi:murein L,D-transpeptidase YcbB/YkuD
MRVTRLSILSGVAIALVVAAASVASATTNSPGAAEVTAPPAAIANTTLADKVRELIASRPFDRISPRKSDRDAIAALYQGRGHAPLWVADARPSDRAKAAIAHLRSIEADALDPNDYPVPNLSAASPDAQAEAEVRFTAVLLSYARHALTGRIHFSRISPNIDYKERFDAADALNKLASSSDVAATLESFHPQQPGYKALKSKLAELRNQPDAGPAPIPNGQALRYAKDKKGKEIVMLDPRVPALRERLGLPAADDTRYDQALSDAVVKFQKQAGLKADGQVSSATIDAINGPNREQRIASVVATMERWRWMPRDLGKTHVVLNIPDFHLRVMNDQAMVWTTRVVVGKPSQATPVLTETMKFITVNPTWNVPQSIIYQELLPIYETSDRAIFDKMGLKVERGRDGDIRVFQPPSERNALGRIRFNFPNKFLVYQHDTPEKHFFAHEKRAYSHGCMRVMDPLKYAEVLLSFGAPKGNYSQESIKKMFGSAEKQIDLPNQIPVHITYQTAFVDDGGKLQFRDDIYGLDAKHQAVFRGPERAVADVGIERPADPNFRPTAQHVRRMNGVAWSGNPFALFDRLFH